MTIRIACLLLLFLAPLAGPAQASQRTDFIAAERALSGGDRAQYLKIKPRLKDYPLYPYLLYREMRDRVAQLQPSEVQGFLEAYSDTPQAVWLRKKWLKHLAQKGRWQQYREFYQDTDNTELRCHQLTALIRTGSQELALLQAEPIWLHGQSRPSACDPLFDAWRAAGRLDDTLVWQRIALAMQAAQPGLARYLARYLPAAERPWVERWIEVHNKPAAVTQSGLFEQDHRHRNAILVHGIQRLAKADENLALAAWERIADAYPFTPVERYQAESAIAWRMLWRNHPQNLEFMDQVLSGEAEADLIERAIREALERRDWKRIHVWIDQLPPDALEEETWRYWRARSLELQGDQASAAALYAELAREPTYYGFLAADRAELPYNLEHKTLTPDLPTLEELRALPAIARAQELLALGRIIDARREWRLLGKRLDADGHLAAARIAAEWGWADRAIFAAAKADYWDDLELRFPLLHREHVAARARERELDDSWIFAVMRQESAFMADVRSSAGAMGLMQLMPATARSVAQGLRLAAPDHHDLTQPDLNINLGTSYLRTLLDQLDQHLVLATAAYNAGPHRVKSWMPDVSTPADVWIETIPFTETRTYVKRVLAYRVFYDRRLGKETVRLAHHMHQVGATQVGATETTNRAADSG